MKRMPVLLLLMFGSSAAFGQYFDKFYGVGMSFSAPLSNRDYINDASLKSGRFFYRELLNERVSAGLDVTYTQYDDYIPAQTYTSGSQTVFTDFYPYTTQIGVSLAGEYLFRPEGRLIPYAGLAVGADYARLKLYYNIYSNTETKWSPLVRPYGGAILRLGTKTSWGFFACAVYQHSFLKAPDYGYSGLSSVGLQAGLVYLNW